MKKVALFLLTSFMSGCVQAGGYGVCSNSSASLLAAAVNLVCSSGVSRLHLVGLNFIEHPSVNGPDCFCPSDSDSNSTHRSDGSGRMSSFVLAMGALATVTSVQKSKNVIDPLTEKVKDLSLASKQLQRLEQPARSYVQPQQHQSGGRGADRYFAHQPNNRTAHRNTAQAKPVVKSKQSGQGSGRPNFRELNRQAKYGN